MTAQIADTILYKGDEYELIGVEGGELATPEQFGMEAEMMHTACYRGYYATYELTDEALFLVELTINEKDGNYQPIGGVKPEREDYEATYQGLREEVPFTGRMRLALTPTHPWSRR